MTRLAGEVDVSLVHGESTRILRSPVSKLAFTNILWRPKASPGLWLIVLIPLASLPGFYSSNIKCSAQSRTLTVLAFQVGISSLYILKSLWQKSVTVEQHAHPKTLWRNLLSSPYIPSLASAVTLIYLTDINPVVAAICCTVCCWVQYRLTEWIFGQIGGSFTAGEGMLIGQAGALTLALSLKGVFKPPKSFSDLQKISGFVQAEILVCFSLCVVLWKLRRRLSLKSTLVLVCVGIGLGVGVSSVLLAEWSPSWLFTTLFVSPVRFALIGWWLNLGVILIVITSVSNRFEALSRTVVRKLYHLLLVVIFLPGIILDPSLTFLASSTAMVFFLLIEFLRFLGVEPLSKWVTEAFAPFLDEKDSGPLIVSHLTLLGALSMPLWLFPCPMERTRLPARLPLLAGLLSVGIGDAFASVAGSLFGRKAWPGTDKTVEGSAFGALAQLSVIGLLTLLGIIPVGTTAWPKVIVSVLLTVAVEAFTDQVDNIVLPLLLFTPLMEP